MKNTRALVMIGISFIVALGAVYLAKRWVDEQGQLGTTKIAVAATDIEIGTRLTAMMIRMADWPSASVPANAVPEEAKLVDRVVKVSVQRGEPILETKLAPEGTKGGLSAVVAEGKRAMTVRVNDVIGVAGFALPGNYVDIIVNTQEEGKGQAAATDKSISKIVLEHILVLAVAQEAGRDDTKPKVVTAVTLEVTPKEAEILDLGRSVGTLSLVLRNQVDPKLGDTAGANKTLLLTGVRETVPAPKSDATAPTPTPTATAKSAPAPRKKIASAAPPPPRKCAKVITGVTESQDCF
jgi:pilus assembly protein CpaB